jgi:hypothetical protein
MALTFTITPTAGGSAISYEANSHATGRYARAFDAGGYIADLRKFRPTGTDGQLIVRAGQIGHKINMMVRYIGATIDACNAAMDTDLSSYSVEAHNITCLGITYTGCNLVPGSVKMASTFKATGRAAGNTYCDVVMMWTEDQP